MKTVIALATLAGVCLSVVATGPAAADELRWQVRSEYPYRVQIEFYSQDRDAAWPGGDRAYALNDSDVHTYDLECISGEKICYGAWVTSDSSVYWGAGIHGERACDDCCSICGDGTPRMITLTD